MAMLKSKPGEDGADDTFRVRYVAGVISKSRVSTTPKRSLLLNAPLEETMYMLPPPGVLKPGQEGMVCHLGFYQ